MEGWRCATRGGDSSVTRNSAARNDRRSMSAQPRDSGMTKPTVQTPDTLGGGRELKADGRRLTLPRAAPRRPYRRSLRFAGESGRDGKGGRSGRITMPPASCSWLVAAVSWPKADGSSSQPKPVRYLHRQHVHTGRLERVAEGVGQVEGAVADAVTAILLPHHEQRRAGQEFPP